MTKIKLIDTRSLILSVKDRWFKQYGSFNDKYKHDIYTRLCALQLSLVSEVEVGLIIGNETWTQIGCNICGKLVKKAVVIEFDDCEYPNVTICQECNAEIFEHFGKNQPERSV